MDLSPVTASHVDRLTREAALLRERIQDLLDEFRKRDAAESERKLTRCRRPATAPRLTAPRFVALYSRPSQ